MALEDEENNCLQLEDHEIDECLKDDALSVLVHIHGGKSINFEGFKIAMGKAGRCCSFSIQRFDDLFYHIYFGTQETVDFVLNNGPWNFDNNLVLVRPRSSTSPSLHRDLEKEYFWLLLTGLRYFYTMEVGYKLAKVLESCQIMHQGIGYLIPNSFVSGC